MALSKSLYIHIPFCDHICSYCDFPKVLKCTNYQKQYLEALKKELDSIPTTRLETIFIGGGTPTSLNYEDLEGLLDFIAKRFKVSKEYSIETNPENLDDDKIYLLKKYGINRVCLGVQTIDQRQLQDLNRHHSKEDVTRAVHKLQEVGIKNINLDFIYGLKNETKEDILANIEFASSLKVTHISYYSLQIESGTELFNRKNYIVNEDNLASDYDFIRFNLAKKGYSRYEVSNFSLKGYQCQHNITYWRNRDYFAAGLGATSYIDNIRSTRTRNIINYISNKKVISESTCEDNADVEFNYLMLNLRLEKGFLLKEFTKLFGKDFLKEYSRNIEKMRQEFRITKSRFAVRRNKLYVLDSLLVDLLNFKDENIC